MKWTRSDTGYLAAIAACVACMASLVLASPGPSALFIPRELDVPSARSASAQLELFNPPAESDGPSPEAVAEAQARLSPMDASAPSSQPSAPSASRTAPQPAAPPPARPQRDDGGTAENDTAEQPGLIETTLSTLGGAVETATRTAGRLLP